MVCNIYFQPLIDLVHYALRAIKRCKDKSFTKDGTTTNSSGIQQYVDIHSGPEYSMHYKYSAIQNIIYITMVFGVGMPLLFPIAAVSLLVMYISEKFMLYYVNKRPPVYDSSLHDLLLENIEKPQLFLLVFGYWMLSNPKLQQSYDKLVPKGLDSDPVNSIHYWYNVLTPSGIK